MAAPDGFDIAMLVVSLLASVLYAIVAVVLSRRPVSREARLAQRGFILWWGGLAGVHAHRVVFESPWGFSVAEHGLPLALLQRYLFFLLVMVILWGLSFYMLYLYTGRRRLWVWPAGYFVLLMACAVFVTHGFGGACVHPTEAGCAQPAMLQEGDGPVLGSGEERPAWTDPALLIGLVLPPMVAAVMYFLLFFKVRDPTSRYRIAVVSGSILLWFGFAVVDAVLTATSAYGPSATRALVGRCLGLLTALLVLSAYFPPRFLQRRLGVEPLVLPSS